GARRGTRGARAAAAAPRAAARTRDACRSSRRLLCCALIGSSSTSCQRDRRPIAAPMGRLRLLSPPACWPTTETRQAGRQRTENWLFDDRLAQSPSQLVVSPLAGAGLL